MPDAPLMLSVSGLRGLIGRSLTPEVAVRYGAAVGQWFAAKAAGGSGGGGEGGAHVVVARDSRPSGPMIESAVIAGLVGVGCGVTRVGIVSTPGAAIMVEHLSADGGIVITASHNPIIWNGIKTLRADGVAPPADEAQQIIESFHGGKFAYAAVEDLRAIGDDDEAVAVHVARVLSAVDGDAIRAGTGGRRKLKVVLDSVHGAGGPESAALLRELGVELVHLYAEPTGLFPHTPEPTRQNLTGLCQAVREHGADVGFAQDPDADRLAIVDEQGRYIGEEYTLALAVEHVLKRGAAEGGAGGGAVAANLSTSRMIDDIAGRYGAKVLRTAVGEANVVAAMKRDGAVVGGEGNGGVILPGVIGVRDSLVGIALVLEMLAADDRPLSAIVNDIPAYAIVKEKVDIAPGMSDRLHEALAGRFSDARIDRQDGVRLDWPDRWVHVRPSNTEPILRLIAEAPDEQAAKELVSKACDALGIDGA